MSDVDEGGFENITFPIAPDNLKKVCWRTKEGEIIPLPEMEDKHLRNVALFLMDMGYTRCIAPQSRRIIWLQVLSMEWQRRMLERRLDKTIFKETIIESLREVKEIMGEVIDDDDQLKLSEHRGK